MSMPLTVILLPLHPAFRMHENPQDAQYFVVCIPWMQRMISRSEDVFVRIPCLCEFLWLFINNAYFFYSFLCFTIEEVYFISVNCSAEFWGLTSN